MKEVKRKQSSPETEMTVAEQHRTIRIEPSSTFAEIELLTFISSPDAPERRESAVTYAAAILGPVTDDAANLALRAITSSADRKVVLERIRAVSPQTTENALSAWLASAGASAICESARSVRQLARDALFLPNGGFGGVAEARGLAHVIESVAHGMKHGAISAALQLIIVARLHLHHSGRSKMTASLGRARAVLEKTSTNKDNAFGLERTQQAYWKRCGALACQSASKPGSDSLLVDVELIGSQ